MSADMVILQENSDHSSRGEVETDKEHMSTEGRGKPRSPVKRKSRVLSSLTRDDIVRLFDFPIETAARLVGVGETALKRRCRELGIVRWKHRTLMGFRNIASSLQIPSEELTRCFEEDPNLELGANLCKVRQKVYKERHQSKICATVRQPTVTVGQPHSANPPASGRLKTPKPRKVGIGQPPIPAFGRPPEDTLSKPHPRAKITKRIKVNLRPLADIANSANEITAP